MASKTYDGATREVQMDGDTHVTIYKSYEEALRGAAEQVIFWINTGSSRVFSEWHDWDENRNKYLQLVASGRFRDAQSLVVEIQGSAWQIHVETFRFSKPRTGQEVANLAQLELDR